MIIFSTHLWADALVEVFFHSVDDSHEPLVLFFYAVGFEIWREICTTSLHLDLHCTRHRNYYGLALVHSVFVHSTITMKCQTRFYLNANRISMIIQTAITPPRISESLLFLKFIFWTRLLMSGKRAGTYLVKDSTTHHMYITLPDKYSKGCMLISSLTYAQTQFPQQWK